MRFLSQGRDGAACSFDHYARLFPRRNLAMGLAAANFRAVAEVGREASEAASPPSGARALSMGSFPHFRGRRGSL
jgi:hypothetical protein